MSERRQLALMLAPYVVGALLLFVIPAQLSFALALTDADLLTTPDYVGLQNLRALLHDPVLSEVLWRSALFVAVAVPLRLALATGFALLHARALPGRRARRGRRPSRPA